MDSLKKLVPLILLSTRACVAAERRKCYYPNGDLVLADSPCDPDAEHSACCGAPPFGVACLSNKLCRTQPGDFSRGSCTDPTWQSPECPSFCMYYASIGVTLGHCSSGNGNDTYCCPSTSDDCCDDSSAGQLTLGTSLPFTWAEWVGSSTGYYTVATPLPSTSRTSSTSSTTTDTASFSSSSSSTSAIETASATSSPDASSGLSTGAQAGIGIGIAVAALLLGAGAFLWWRVNQNNKKKKLGEPLSQGDPDSPWGPSEGSVTVVGGHAHNNPPSEMPVTAEKYELVAPHVPHSGYTDVSPTVSAATGPHYAVQLPADQQYAELPVHNH